MKFLPKFPLLPENIPLLLYQEMWVIHDGTLLHFGVLVRASVYRISQNHRIGRGGPSYSHLEDQI